MNKDFIQNFLEKGYELKQQCNIVITSCVNYSYFIVYKKENKDLLILSLEDGLGYFIKPRKAHIIHLEDIYKALYSEINHIEMRKVETYETYTYKDSYRNYEHYEQLKQQNIQWHQTKVDALQEFIDNYLELLKNRYK